LWLENPEVSKTRQDSLHPFRKKPKKKLAKNQKQPPRHPGVIQRFVDLALEGKTFESRPERLLQEVAVRPSAETGLLGDSKNLAVSGDGTCINSGGSPYGIEVCDCKSKGIYNCDCQRRFSDPEARYGWNSYHEKWFYGHSAYLLSVYNKELKVDLPIFLRMVQAQRYDGVTAWKIKPFIPLNVKNKGNFLFPPPINVDVYGTPVCMAGFPMVNWGFEYDRCRIKWRCPYALGKVDSCPCMDKCSASPYGRTVYTKPSWDLRIFTPVPPLPLFHPEARNGNVR
jgi:hypothetical protein